jgi:hypothetical protein
MEFKSISSSLPDEPTLESVNNDEIIHAHVKKAYQK